MTEKIVPFKELEYAKEIEAKNSLYNEAEEYFKKSHDKRFYDLLSESAHGGVTDSMIIVGLVGGIINFVVAMAKGSLFFFALPFSGYILLCMSVDSILMKTIFNKKIAKKLIEAEDEERLKLNALNREAAFHVSEIKMLNSELNTFNQLLKRIDDFRPLNDEENAKYQALTKRRQDLGLRILDFEDRLRLAQIAEGKELLALPAVPSMSRLEIEKQMEAKRKLIEEATEEYKRLEKDHAALYSRVMS